jgi:hypothetical protein
VIKTYSRWLAGSIKNWTDGSRLTDCTFVLAPSERKRTEAAENEPPPPKPPDESHERVVTQVPHLELGDKIVITTGGGVDTGWRQVFPLTYDIPTDHPEATRTAEDT